MATYYKGDGTTITIPSASSVDTAQLVDNAVTYNKLAEAVQDQLDSGGESVEIYVEGTSLVINTNLVRGEVNDSD